jgi:hypothetical protein
MLDVNGYLPKSKKESYSSGFRDAKFFLTTEEEVEKESEETIRREILKGKYLSELFGDKVNYERAWEIAYYMGLKPKKGASETKLQADLYMAVTDKVLRDEFIRACQMDNEDIQIANLFKQGVSLDLVRYDGGIKCYTFGATNLRETEAQSVDYLKTPGMSTALAQLREAVNKRKAKSKNLA